MRLVPFLALAALGLCACPSQAPSDKPPLGRFYFPTGVAFVPGATGPGTLYVATSDFDKRFGFGALSAVDLGALDWDGVDAGSAGLDLRSPWYLTPGAPVGALPSQPVEITDLKLTDAQRVYISPFAGNLAVWHRPDGSGDRLFVPTRAEGDNLFVIDAAGSSVTCFGEDPAERNCVGPAGQPTAAALSLTDQAREAGKAGGNGFRDGKPRAPEPYAAAVRASDGTVFVTHVHQADSPIDTGLNRESYLVHLSAESPAITADSFSSIGSSPAAGVAAGSRYAYVIGRLVGSTIPPVLRLVDPGRRPIVTSVEQDIRVIDGRAVVLSEDETRAFLLGREPDTLIVLSVSGATTDSPSVRLIRSVLLPSQPNDLKLIPRGPGRGALLAITCTGAGAVALYDDETGQLSTLVTGVGIQPYGIAVDRPENAPGARLFVSNFGDGRVAVIDVPDVNRPYNAFIAAQLGERQLCLTDQQNNTDCPQVAP